MQLFLTSIFLIIILLVLILYLFRFFLKVKHNRDFENNLDAFISLLVSAIMCIFILSFAFTSYSKTIDNITKYSAIPIYFFTHLLLCLLFIYIFSLWNIFISSVIKEIIGFTNIMFKPIYRFFLKSMFFRKYIDPYNGISSHNTPYSTIRFIKSILFACYLLSGIVVISPFYNWLIKSDGISTYLPVLKTDIEIYRSIFVVSLIPFFLNYIFNKPKPN